MPDSEELEKASVVETPLSDKPFGRLNSMLLVVGLVLLVVGFLTLTQVDPEANNLAGILAPILIIGSYVIIFVSLIVED